ncbi:hypothetical protein B4135_2365 [Caldibacillus debilis]|uniref:Uncharacterized protein n=1 Tax=Caldibacillus debilis TaxID=301148 RepID=A0A150M147_9BACI|nr:hypothetical protein B4135_2365 [Caldibacillus debilis]
MGKELAGRKANVLVGQLGPSTERSEREQGPELSEKGTG